MGSLMVHATDIANNLPLVKAINRTGGKNALQTLSAQMASPDRPYSDIAERIAWHRELEGMTQADYAHKAGLKRSQLKNWETGSHRLGLDGALALRKTYGLSLDFLYEGIDDALDMTLRRAWRDRPAVRS